MARILPFPLRFFSLRDSGWLQRFRLPESLPHVVGVLLIVLGGQKLHAQCLENNYIHDGAPSSMRDCQPLAALRLLTPEEMQPADRQVVEARHADLERASRFYGFDIDAPGWSYRQAISPLLHKHVLLLFTNATPAIRASRFTAIVPEAGGEKVEVLPAFTHGLRPFDPGWQAKGTYADFNRLVTNERGEQPISLNSDWIEYAVLYLTMIGQSPAVPTDTDSIQANWDLTVKRGTTPMIFVRKDGAANITVTDVSNAAKTASWKLVFDRHGHVLKADRTEHTPQKVLLMKTMTGTAAPPTATALPASTVSQP